MIVAGYIVTPVTCYDNVLRCLGSIIVEGVDVGGVTLLYGTACVLAKQLIGFLKSTLGITVALSSVASILSDLG